MKGVVAFATLFLGFTLGQHPVELLVGHDVASVELRLDGDAIGRLASAPWIGNFDLGGRLEPRRLEAVAYSAAGEELGRAEQWLNIPQTAARTEILLDRDPESGRVTANVSWNSLTSDVPVRVSAAFDGAEIPAPDPAAIVLPRHDPEQLHYLKVELEFPHGFVAAAERTFGGSFVDDVATELTAVALELGEGAREPSDPPTGWLRARGRGLDIVELGTGPADLILVRDQGAQAALDRMVRRRYADYRAVASLKRGFALRLVRPVTESLSQSLRDIRVFKPSTPLTATDGGMFWLLTSIRAPRVDPSLQRISDAVAGSAAAAAVTGRRRAVVLLVGPEPADHSQHRPAEVLHYLEQMRVPLVVWSTAGAVDTPWGPAADVSSLTRLERETKRLMKAVDRQRIAWVRGVYLPPEITLAATGSGIRLAGT